MEDTQQALPDLARLLAGVNAAPDAGLLVIIANRGGLGVVGSEALGECVGIVIGTLDQRLAGNVVLHLLLGRVEDLVVRAARGRVHQTAGDTGDEQGVVNLQFNGVLKFLLAGSKHVIQALGLSDSPRETVQDETAIVCQLTTTRAQKEYRSLPVLAFGVVIQFALDHVDHDLVADETTLVHDLFGLLAEIGLLCDL